MTYHSQHGQDQFVHEVFFPHKRNGVFIDIGASDGVMISNSLFFEQEMDWTGLCFEPIPCIFEQLRANRRCTCINACVADYDGTGQFLEVCDGGPHVLSGLVDRYDPRHIERIDRENRETNGAKKVIEVKCVRLMPLLELFGIKRCDFLSIDVEGAEFDILRTLDFSKVLFDVLTIENNYDTPEIANYLSQAGYRLVEKLGCDEVYKWNRPVLP